MSTQKDQLDALAGEYVLGLMSDAERLAFEAQTDRDAAARKALLDAQERFSEFDMTAPAAAAPADLWTRIAAEIDKPEKVVPFRRPAPKPRPAEGSRFWQGFTAAAAVAVVLALIGFATMRSFVLRPQPQLIVVLLDAQAQPGAIIEASYSGETIRVVPLSQINVPEGKTLEVWTLPSPQTGPVSVGLLEQAKAKTLKTFKLPPPQPQQLYEITLEQAGGSPTGKPTGPVIAKGFARQPQI
jgi:anti-sigma-K factor RskA